MEKRPKLILVIPCYNEEEVLPVTAPLFLGKIRQLADLGRIAGDSRILFVNDGSTDATWDIIGRLSASDPHYTGISQSRNRGHQNALLAGLMESMDRCDMTITMDCDGQDDIEAVDRMIDAREKGAEIVYGVRSSRASDGWFKRTSAQCFYRLMKKMGAECIYNHADYRLVSNRALKAFSDFKEVNLYLRGMFPLVGFNSTCVYYERRERAAGKSHYPFKKMLSFAAEGITDLSVRPVNIIAGLGGAFSLLSFIGILYALISRCLGHAVSGWTSMICIVCLIGGIQLLSIGMIGIYIGKIYLETKHRPRYIISEKTGNVGNLSP